MFPSPFIGFKAGVCGTRTVLSPNLCCVWYFLPTMVNMMTWPFLLPLLLALVARPTEAAALAPNWSSCASPRGRPDIDCCTLPELLHAGGGANGGAPLHYKELAEYLREKPLPAKTRVRPAAHLVAGNQTYLEQLHRAYKLMAELPSHDPRSHFQQINLHCMSGSEGMVMQLGSVSPDHEYSVHYNWLWLPYHRWYTFFYERILAKLVGDEDFMLPFWNWDNQSTEQDGQPLTFLPNHLPHYYRNPDKYPALFDANRDPRHAPGNAPLSIDLNYLTNIKAGVSADQEDPEWVATVNNQLMHTYMVEMSTKAGALRAGGDVHIGRAPLKEAFLSYPMRAGEPLPQGGDNFERAVHGSVHSWLADTNIDMEDMGNVFSATRDPVFCAHHANIDRLWAVWQSLGGEDFVDPDFLDAAFFFYNEEAELVRVTVADSLDHRKLMYDWQHVDNPWVSPAYSISSDSNFIQPRSESKSLRRQLFFN